MASKKYIATHRSFRPEGPIVPIGTELVLPLDAEGKTALDGHPHWKEVIEPSAEEKAAAAQAILDAAKAKEDAAAITSEAARSRAEVADKAAADAADKAAADTSKAPSKKNAGRGSRNLLK